MRRRSEQEREETDAHAQAEARREALLAELKAREAAGRAPEPPAEPELDEGGPATETAAEETDADLGDGAASDTD